MNLHSNKNLKNPFDNGNIFLDKTYGGLKGDLRIDLLYEQIKRVGPFKSIADIGCGSAPVSARLIKDGGILSAKLFDPSGDLLQEARNKIQDKQGASIEFKGIDHSESCQYIRKHPVDLIISHAVLNWLDNPYQGLNELFEVARETQATVSLMVGSRTGYLLELASKGLTDELVNVIRDGYVTSESYPDRKLFLFDPIDLVTKIEKSGMDIISKNAVRVFVDLFGESNKEKISNTLEKVEHDVANDENYWALGDMVHIIFKPSLLITDKSSVTYTGVDAVLNYLNPDNTPYTPLVEIPDNLNPYRKEGVRIFAKLMNTLPLANIKSLPAYNMLLAEKEKGALPNTLIENSSGNTVFSLAVIARLMGVPHTKAIVSHEVSKGKLNILRFLGTEIIVNEEPICPDPSDPTSGIYKAKVWSRDNGWFNPGQYDNDANPEAHYKWTAPQIWEQTKGKISLLSVGLGTTGSATGIGKYLKEKRAGVEILGVSRIINNSIPGVRTLGLLKEVSFDWKSIIDHQEEVGTVDSFGMSMELCRSGLFVGPSSGFALAGLLKHLSKQELSGEEKIAVFICPDNPFPYMEEYFQYLDPSCFPKIENEHLLKEKGDYDIPKTVPQIKELAPHNLFDLIFNDTPEKIWKALKQSKEKIEPKRGFAIIDIRNDGEYEDHHIPGSIHVLFNNLDTFLLENKDELVKNEAVIFVCRHGNTSRIAAYKAGQIGINSMSLKGGDAEWSRLDLPRIRPDACMVKFELK